MFTPEAKPAFGTNAYARFREAEGARPERRLAAVGAEVFQASFARLGLGLGWAVGIAQTFGTGEGAAFPGSLASLILLILASITLASRLPAPGRFLRLGTHLDSPGAWRMLGLWSCTVLFAVNTLFLTAFPSAHRFFLALLGMEMILLCPGALFLSAWAHRAEPRPHRRGPALVGATVLAGLAAGTLLYGGYGFLLGGTGTDYHGHLVLGALAMTGHYVLWRRHLRFVSAGGKDGGERLRKPVEAVKVKTAGRLSFFFPLPLTLAALLLPSPWHLVFLFAPLCAAGGIFLERLLFHVPEHGFPHDFPERALRKV